MIRNSKIICLVSLLLFCSIIYGSGTGKATNDSLILASVKNGNIETLRKLMGDSKEINKRYGESGRILLNYAIESNQAEIASYLIEHGANPEQQSSSKTALMYAARYGRPELAKILLAGGADINATNRDRNTAFHYAAKYNRLEILKVLYQHEAKINIPNEDQWTALDYSIINNRKEIEAYLRSIGCILFDKDLPNYFDGPYIDIIDSVSYEINYFVNKRGKKGSYLLSKDIKGSGKTIKFKGLGKDRKQYSIIPDPVPPPSCYDEPSRIFVMGDIHGQYERMVEMLIAGGVIDRKLNWKWKDGHLLFVGDILDRGEGVTEALWLIYKLEQQAKESNGVVHLLFGNHEAMIIKNDIRYLGNKYYGLISNLDIKYHELFSKGTILGEWIRSKNAVEIIGNTMFIHAGISPELAARNLSIDDINVGFRSFLQNEDKKSYSELEKFLISNFGPVWYRGYIKSGSNYNEITQDALDSILRQYNVTKVVIGHTEVDLINPTKNDKVIPVNIPLAYKEIIGQALLIEGEDFYRLATDKTKIKLSNLPKN